MHCIDPLRHARIGVATEHGRPYYRFSRYLRQQGIPFDSILPGDMPGYGGSMILTTRAESPAWCHVPVLCEEMLDLPPAMARGIMLRALGRTDGGDLIMGVDPGRRIGLSVSYCGHEIEGSLYYSAGDLASHMAGLMAGLTAARRIVRIGDGDMETAGEIALMLGRATCPPFELELVDEQGTTPRARNRNQGGRRDMLSAKSISRRSGYRQQELPLSVTG